MTKVPASDSPSADDRTKKTFRQLHLEGGKKATFLLPRPSRCSRCELCNRRVLCVAEANQAREMAPQMQLGGGGGAVVPVEAVWPDLELSV